MNNTKQITHFTLLDSITHSTKKGNASFKLETRFIADKITANFLVQYNEWRYINRNGYYRENSSAKLHKGKDVNLDLISGEIKIGLRSMVYSIAQVWAYFMIILVSTFQIKRSAHSKYRFVFSMTKEQIYKNGGTENFSEFIHQERFNFNQENSTTPFLVECRNKRFTQLSSKCLIVTRDISLYVFRNNLVYRKKIKVIVDALRAAIKLTMMLPTCNWLFLFIKEIVIDKPVFRSLENSPNFHYELITTQSHLFARPLPFYWESNYNKTMIWYSSNSFQIQKIGDEFEDFEKSQFETPEIDVHYVWSEAQADFIRERNAREIATKIVGSIVFQPIYKLEKRKIEPRCIRITYFDVTPTSIWYHQSGFYSEDNMSRILMSITKVVNEIENELSIRIDLRLKPKREFKKGHHADGYRGFVDSLVSSKEIEIIESNTDLYALINASDVVIAVPFSSPCLIAREMEVPNAYFSPSSGFKIVNPDERINLFLTERELKKFLMKTLQPISK